MADMVVSSDWLKNIRSLGVNYSWNRVRLKLEIEKNMVTILSIRYMARKERILIEI